MEYKYSFRIIITSTILSLFASGFVASISIVYLNRIVAAHRAKEAKIYEKIINEAARTLQDIKLYGSRPLIVGSLEVTREDISTVQNYVEVVDLRLASLEKALELTPEEAIRIPLVLKELEQMKADFSQLSERQREDSSRIFAFMYSFIGILIPAALSLTIMFITWSVRSRKNPVDRR